jgi:predicted permease
MSGLWHDLRFAARMLKKSPGFAAFVIIALGLGLGVNTAVFGFVNMVLLRPLIGVDHPGGVARVFLGPENEPHVWGRFSFADYTAIRDQDELFSGVLATTFDSCAMSSGDPHHASDAERAELPNGEWVTGNYFEVLGARPLLGRTFTADEAPVPGAASVLVLSYELWQRRFSGDPGVIGRTVYLNQVALTVIGVMPEGFDGTIVGNVLGYWVPLALRSPIGYGDGWITDRQERPLGVMARLRPGVTVEQAEARLNVIAHGLATQYPATNGNTKVSVTSEIQGRFGPDYATVELCLALALGISGLVLLISCANIANLLLARATRRTRELAIRVSLGASRLRIARQLLTESVILAVLAGALGVLAAFWFGDLLRAFLPPMPFMNVLDFHPSVQSLAWAFLVAIGVGLAAGALPAWRASRADVVVALKTDVAAEGQGLRRGGIRQALVIGQLAVSIVVLACGGLFVRSLQKLEALDPGYQVENLVAAQVDPGLFDYDEPHIRQFFVELAGRLEKHHGVQSVSSATIMPLLNLQGRCGPIIKEGDAPALPNQWKPTLYSVVFAKYFETAGTELRLGRDFDEREREGTPSAVIVNGELARRLYGREDEALGKRFRIGDLDAPPLEIVGIAKDGRYENLFEEPKPWIFLPGSFPQLRNGQWTARYVLVRTTSMADMAGAAEAIRSEVAALDARLPVTDVQVGRRMLDGPLLVPRLGAELGVMLGLMALALATMGIYSVMTYAVSQRTKEIGIRMALGARVRDVVRLVLRQALVLIAIGVLLGGAAAFAVTQLLKDFLYGVSASDPTTVAATVVLLVLVGVLATLLPARRATKVDPMVSLRYE